MNNKLKFAVMIAGLLVQGCGFNPAMKSADGNGGQVDALSASVDLKTEVPSDGQGQSPVRSRVVKLHSIAFGRGISIGIEDWYPMPLPVEPSDTPKNATRQGAPQTSPPRPDYYYEEYSYRLDVRNGNIIEISTGNLLRRLNAHEVRRLRSILIGSVIKMPGWVCAALAVWPGPYYQPYARMGTSGGDYELGGSCGAMDLYRAGTTELSGLQPFLDEVEASLDGGFPIDPPVSNDGTLFGYKFSEIASIQYYSKGGLRHVNDHPPVLTLKEPAGKQIGVSREKPDAGCSWVLEPEESEKMRRLLSEAKLVKDTNGPKPVDGGDNHLTITLKSGKVIDHLFQGSETYTGLVIHAPTLVMYLSDLTYSNTLPKDGLCWAASSSSTK